ncbi:MAG: hypothetical protein ACRECD_14130 [Burkholderiaceae bacterium]
MGRLAVVPAQVVLDDDVYGTLARRKPSPVAQVFVRLVHEVLEGAR